MTRYDRTNRHIELSTLGSNCEDTAVQVVIHTFTRKQLRNICRQQGVVQGKTNTTRAQNLLRHGSLTVMARVEILPI